MLSDRLWNRTPKHYQNKRYIVIINQYDDDYPYPSCLILGYNINNKIIHIVCGVSEDTVHIITAYYPNTDKGEEDMKTRRKK